MDTGLFQILSLVLLAATVALLALALSALSGIKKALEAGGARTTAEPEAAAAPEPVDLTPGAETAEPEPFEEARREEAEPAPAQAVAEPGAAAAEPVREPVREEEPAPTDTYAAAGAAQATPGGAAAEPEPENQPFERDGRWWFRRGDELLVYDEQTGQWMPAPQPVPGGGAPAGAGASPAAEAGAGGQAEGAGGFWKCPSCGAVNGSTATSCRMCFAPRP